MTEIGLSGFSRVWIIENGANPNQTPAYQAATLVDIILSEVK